MSSHSSEVVAGNLRSVRQKIQQVCSQHDIPPKSVTLVAVSKTKPIELLVDAYHQGQRHFGENYVQELVAKVETEALPDDIHWHFIGPLQSNKANVLVKTVVPKAASLTVETVSSLKLATKLHKAMESLSLSLEQQDEKNNNKPKLSFLDIFIQVNTSGEESKSGVEPNGVVALCQEILANCPTLRIKGLMTIGAPGDWECFDTLVTCKQQVIDALLPFDHSSLELSMGMSSDYEQAIARGATNVRVGSTIFGERDYAANNKEEA
jgi:pyridoxal phosphate enzyme (YggS family)